MACVQTDLSLERINIISGGILVDEKLTQIGRPRFNDGFPTKNMEFSNSVEVLTVSRSQGYTRTSSDCNDLPYMCSAYINPTLHRNGLGLL